MKNKVFLYKGHYNKLKILINDTLYFLARRPYDCVAESNSNLHKSSLDKADTDLLKLLEYEE